jgi:hypothetical protein
MDYRKVISEFLGTFGLIFAGTGAIVINQASGGAITHVGIALTFGLVVLAMVYTFGKRAPLKHLCEPFSDLKYLQFLHHRCAVNNLQCVEILRNDLDRGAVFQRRQIDPDRRFDAGLDLGSHLRKRGYKINNQRQAGCCVEEER